MNLGIDLDDTITNAFDILFNCAQKFDIEVLKRDGKIEGLGEITHCYYCKELHGWTQEQQQEFLDMYYQDLLTDVKPKRFAVETINKIKETGHKVYIVTRRYQCKTGDVKEFTQNWLQQNGILYDELVTNCTDKKEVCKKRNIEVFLDDSIQNCLELQQEGIQSFLMDTKLNANVDTKGIERIYSWPYFYHRLEKLGRI